MKTETPQPIHLTDYKPVPYLIDSVDLDFRLDPTATEVRSRLSLRPNPASAEKHAPLVLDGERITLTSLVLDGADHRLISFSSAMLFMASWSRTVNSLMIVSRSLWKRSSFTS
jgi:aminopeptidase N